MVPLGRFVVLNCFARVHAFNGACVLQEEEKTRRSIKLKPLKVDRDSADSDCQTYAVDNKAPVQLVQRAQLAGATTKATGQNLKLLNLLVRRGDLGIDLVQSLERRVGWSNMLVDKNWQTFFFGTVL